MLRRKAHVSWRFFVGLDRNTESSDRLWGDHDGLQVATSPKLVCIDIQPDRADILTLGGFRDAVFPMVATFLSDDAAQFAASVNSAALSIDSPKLA
ncbi:hypothetical protein DSM3645_26344 [Blastopirellula marina DSM 3645]|uniref:Uncharacterized protein n=1 Tax=Blastopirellula marina DSM 3645 TaxID=314230 RepID=A3ZWI2_9BACT|nr:hypothetical protein DSM3645_26344 [Blastopirellula marina DSM 3645]